MGKEIDHTIYVLRYRIRFEEIGFGVRGRKHSHSCVIASISNEVLQSDFSNISDMLKHKWY